MEGDLIWPTMKLLSLSVRFCPSGPEVLGIERSYFVHSIVIIYQVYGSLQVNKLLMIY